MKYKTATKIERALPYALSVLAGAGTFAVMRLYGSLCVRIGADIGTGDAIRAFKKFDEKACNELLENANPPWIFDW